MNTRPRISVAMPTYNGQAFLAEQLQSIAAQSWQPDELVISDDASRDDTMGVASIFAQTSPFPIRLHRNDSGLGCNENFAKAISLCSGDFIALSDQDDVWQTDHIEKLVAPMVTDPELGLVISNSDYVDQSLQSMGTDLWRSGEFTAADVGRIGKGPQFSQWLRHHVSAGHALAFRASLAEIILPFHPNWMYDRWLSLVCAACSRIALVDEKLTLHRHHARQTVGHTYTPLTVRATQQRSVSSEYFGGQALALRALRDRLKENASHVRADDVWHALDERIGLFDTRQRMREGGIARRISMAMAALVSGRYHRNARGWLTFARDVRG